MKKTLAILITTFSLSLGLTPGFTGISGNLVIEAAAHPGGPVSAAGGLCVLLRRLPPGGGYLCRPGEVEPHEPAQHRTQRHFLRRPLHRRLRRHHLARPL